MALRTGRRPNPRHVARICTAGERYCGRRGGDGDDGAAGGRAAGGWCDAAAHHRRAKETRVTGLRQIAAVTLLNLRTIPQRLGSSAVAVFGIAGVVIVLVAVLSIAEGFFAAMKSAGS